MFCKHKYGEVKENYQYCIKCGKARYVKEKCNHVFKINPNLSVKKFVMHNGKFKLDRYTISNVCTKCGKIQLIVLE